MRTIKGDKKKTVDGTALRLYMTYIKALTGMYIDEVDEDFKNPFRKYKLPKKRIPTVREIDVSLLRKIFTAKCEDRYEQLGQDVAKIIFMLCGANIIDIYNLKKPVKNRIVYERSKTKDKREDRAKISIQVQPELLPLIDKYADTQLLFRFHRMYATSDNLMEAVNNGLKKLCNRLDVQKITSYYFRGSWATIGRNDLHIDFKDISIGLNHAQNSVTDKYIKPDFSIIDRCNRQILDYVFITKGNLRVVKMAN